MLRLWTVRPTLHTVISLATAILVVAGQLLATGHALAERHSLCDQHGEVIHAPAAAELAGTAHTLEALPPLQHDHGCGLLTGLVAASEPPLRAHPPLLFERPDATPALPQPAPAPPPPPALAAAPKTSPPAMPTTA